MFRYLCVRGSSSVCDECSCPFLFAPQLPWHSKSLCAVRAADSGSSQQTSSANLILHNRFFCECIVLTFRTTESNDVLRCGAVSEQVYSSPQDHAKCASTRHRVSSPVAVQVHFQLRLVRTSHGSTPKFCRLPTFEVWTVFSRICLGCAQLHPRGLDNVAQNKFEIFQQLRSILLVRLDFRSVLLRLSCQSILFRFSSAAVCQSSQLGVLLLQSQSRLHGKVR